MFDWSLIDWSRAQFALTAGYHWLFVPFTLGVTYIIATMITIYYFTGNELWKNIARFWTKIFAINFAIGVATGIILEFEFGTNWSNYSWFVGDIFGAPLVIEGVIAFFLETTFLAVLLLGWDKVGKGFHMTSAWLVAFGSSFSAVWILVANGWMQHPTGMEFNPDLMRNEMKDFWAVVANPVALSKLFHVISQALLFASVNIIGISAWYLLKGREKEFATKSMVLAAIFGLTGSVLTIIAGDITGKDATKYQPMKVAALEGLYRGSTEAPFAFLACFGKEDPVTGMRDVKWKFEMHGALSWILMGDTKAFVPGIYDLLYGNPDHDVTGAVQRIQNGKAAIESLKQYKEAKAAGDTVSADMALRAFRANEKDLGYGYLDENNLGELVPNVPFLFWAFRYMVALGFLYPLFFLVVWIRAKQGMIEKCTPLLKFALILIPLTYLSSQLGWAVAEVGRQPWIVYELMPTKIGASASSATIVMAVFFGFLVIFTLLLIAALGIAIKTIKEGPGIAEK